VNINIVVRLRLRLCPELLQRLGTELQNAYALGLGHYFFYFSAHCYAAHFVSGLAALTLVIQFFSLSCTNHATQLASSADSLLLLLGMYTMHAARVVSGLAAMIR
jgi:hypothetical protein